MSTDETSLEKSNLYLVTRADLNPLKSSLRECSVCKTVDWYGLPLDSLKVTCVRCMM